MSPNRFERDDDVEAVGEAHEMRGQDVDVELVGPDAGIARGHRLEALVPVRHRDRDAVRLGRRRDVLRRPLRGELERELQDAVDALAREHGLLEHDLAVGALVHAPADRRVLALGVLADDDEVDVAGLAVRERRRDAGHQAARPQVHVLVEARGGTGSASPTATRGPAPSPASRPRRRRSRRAATGSRTSPPASSGRASRSGRSPRRIRCHSKSMPKRRAAASSTRSPSGTTLLADAVARNDRDAMRCHRPLLSFDILARGPEAAIRAMRWNAA